MSNYDHKLVENKWKTKWYENNLYKAVDFDDRPKKYILAEFPYPSGKALHAGHMMRYTLPDVYARYLRMKGFNVMFPLGLDAFGLPAETNAIREHKHPSEIIGEISTHYLDSMMRMGYSIDTARIINTTDPKYYKWTQWIFLKLWKAGLADYKEMPIWWCENLKTVLADEEVLTDKNGNKISERGEHPVEKRMFKQWALKIPQYAEKLIKGLEKVDFPQSIKSAQTNWIGKSEGVYVDFEIKSENEKLNKVKVFTTRPDTIFGVTFLALAPENPLLLSLLNKVTNKDEVKEYIFKSKSKSDLERQSEKIKTGVELKGLTAVHPFEEVKTPIRIFVADYILMDYGTGSIMGVPAHDERDFDFAKKYEINIVEVIKPINERVVEANESTEKLFAGYGTVINSGKYDGTTSEAFAKIVAQRLKDENTGESTVTYKIRDWVFSRQRYWGEPIPMVHRADGTIEGLCDPDNVEEVAKMLPLELPQVPDYNPSDDGASPLERNQEWVKTTDSQGNPAKRETNTMPNWAGSCWYYIRYCDPKNNNEFADFEKIKYWLPVDKYFGGAEHTTLHLLYSRFWHKFLFDQGLLPTDEPYAWRLNGGLLLGPDGKKMSKSKGNVVEPIEIVEKFGADALRMAICFLGPYEDTYPWNDNGMKATSRLINTIYGLKDIVKSGVNSSEDVLKAYNRTIKRVGDMYENLKMNTVVSDLMIFVNLLKMQNEIDLEMWKGFLKIVAPIAPFVAEELWSDINGGEINKSESIHIQKFPEYDKKYLVENTITMPVQINGKIKSEIIVASDETEENIDKMVRNDEKVLKAIEGKTIKKVIYIKGKIVNVVC